MFNGFEFCIFPSIVSLSQPYSQCVRVWVEKNFYNILIHHSLSALNCYLQVHLTYCSLFQLSNESCVVNGVVRLMSVPFFKFTLQITYQHQRSNHHVNQTFSSTISQVQPNVKWMCDLLVDWQVRCTLPRCVEKLICLVYLKRA